METGMPVLWAEPLTETIHLLLIQEVKGNAMNIGIHSREPRPLMMCMPQGRVLTGFKETGMV